LDFENNKTTKITENHHVIPAQAGIQIMYEVNHLIILDPRFTPRRGPRTTGWAHPRQLAGRLPSGVIAGMTSLNISLGILSLCD